MISLSQFNGYAGFTKESEARARQGIPNFFANEKLSKERTQALIEHYLYAEKEPLRDEILDLLEGDRPTLLKRKTTGDRILNRIVDFVETFVNGVAGS